MEKKPESKLILKVSMLIFCILSLYILFYFNSITTIQPFIKPSIRSSIDVHKGFSFKKLVPLSKEVQLLIQLIFANDSFCIFGSNETMQNVLLGLSSQLSGLQIEISQLPEQLLVARDQFEISICSIFSAVLFLLFHFSKALTFPCHFHFHEMS